MCSPVERRSPTSQTSSLPRRCWCDRSPAPVGVPSATRTRTADGPPQRIRDKGQQHLPGDEAWLIGEHRSSGEKKYYLANLPAATSLRTLAATIKARWICEQAHQQLKEELGLDHLKGDPGKVSTAMRS